MQDDNEQQAALQENPEHHLHEQAHVVRPPWSDTGTFVVLGSEDPHLARFLCDTDSDLWDCPGDGRATDQRHAEEIARRWNEAAELRELIYIWGEARQGADEYVCTEQDTGACSTVNIHCPERCEACSRAIDSFDALQGIERVMQEKYDDLREAGYER